MLQRTCLALILAAPLASAQVQVYDYLGVAAGDQAARSVAGAGDVDGDGWPDVVVGIPGSDAAGTDAGHVEVLSGRDGSIVLSVYGSAPGGFFGYSVDGVGDLDGDGRADLIVGSPWADFAAPKSGMVSILSGTGQVLANLSFGATQQYCGLSAAGVGDVDGTSDFAFGSQWYDGAAPDSGRVDVVSGKNFQVLFSREGTQASEYLGRSIDGAGDVDGNGRDDVVIGAPGTDNAFNSQVDVGKVEVWSYVPFQGSLLFSRLGSHPNDALGQSVAGLGDVDGDGVPDVAAGSPTALANGTYSGHARVISGAAPHAVLWSQDGAGGSQLGHAVIELGDLDGDGLGELGLSSPYSGSAGVPFGGLVQAISSQGGYIVHSWSGSEPGEQLGRSLASAGDLNLDGVPDVVMGTELFDALSYQIGHALVVLCLAPVPQHDCTSKQNSAGCTPTIAWSGAPCTSIADTFHVSAAAILNNVPGRLIWSHGQASIPFGGGTLCVAPPVKRTPGQLSGMIAGTACGGSFDFHVSHAFLAANVLTPRLTFYAQYWSRDTGFTAPNNMSLTDGLEITVVP